ncbi:MAG: response regulator [Elusimicrobia bacterium]|nr:response regulator [Elusimicrobiota bacterium]
MPKKILVVDDDPNARELIRLVLSKYDCEVMEAANGQEGLDVALKERPGLIITDHLMPNFTGYELFQRVRAETAMKKTRFIMVTTKHFDSEFPELLKLEGCDFVSKPFHVASLVGAIERLLGPLPFKI